MKRLNYIVLILLTFSNVVYAKTPEVQICEELNYAKLETLSKEKSYYSKSKQKMDSGILRVSTLYAMYAFINHSGSILSKYDNDYNSYYDNKHNCEKCLVERERIIDFLKYKNLNNELAEIRKRDIDGNKINCDE